MPTTSLLQRLMSGLAFALGTALIGAPALAAAADAASSPDITEQAEGFIRKIKSGALTSMSDDQLIKTFTQLDPNLIPAYLELGVKPLNEYELTMRRQERIDGSWNNDPFLNHVKYRHKPRQVYMAWLKGSAKAGQEIIYDETKRKDAMYGHLGGMFNIASIWISLDGSKAKGNSNHPVSDVGLQTVVDIVSSSHKRRLKEGLPVAPGQIEVVKINGERCVALTWLAPAGVKGLYAAKSKICVDLKQPLIRQTESWDEAGQMFERISFDKVTPAAFTDADFDPKNPAYDF